MTSYLPPIPPVVPPNAELGAEWVKRYMSDQSQFRDVLRKWILSANACCDTNTTAIADHETRIDALETGGGGTGDVVGPGTSVDRNITIFDDTTGKLIADSGVAMDDVVVAMSQAAASISLGKMVALRNGTSFL